MLNRRDFLKGAGAGLAGHAFGAGVARPNVVQILIDDMGFADLGCYGGQIETPHIDRLAARGIRFMKAYDASPVCSASRVGILTGQFPSRQYIYSYLDTRQRQRELHERDWLDPKAPSIARTFKLAGYATGHFGKWHMGGGRDVGDAPVPTEYGFDDYMPAYRLGGAAGARYGDTPFEAFEDDLAQEYRDARGNSRLDWEQAHPAVRAAWTRVRTEPV